MQLDLDDGDVERAETLLESLGALALTVSDGGDQPLLQPAPGAEPLWRRCRIEALFPLDLAPAELRMALRGAGFDAHKLDILEDQDWENRWRQHSVSCCFGDRLWLVPRDEPPRAEPVLRLDPGLAFGSGSHPTTRLCLGWLAGQDLDGSRVLDFGCGSGVLGLAALKLGCARVLAVDHDPQALLATQDNAAYNGLLNGRLTVGQPELLGEQDFDVILANILANPLIELAPVLTAALAPGGTLVLSGMLASQADSVMAAYPALEFDKPLLEADEQDAVWACLLGRHAAGTGPGPRGHSR